MPGIWNPAAKISEAQLKLSSSQCGSALIFYGSGSGYFSQCWSGFGCFFNEDPDPAFTNYHMKDIPMVEKRKKDWPKVKTLELVQTFTKNLNKITIITNFLANFCCYFWIVPSWIRIQIQEGKWMLIHEDPDPQPWFNVSLFVRWYTLNRMLEGRRQHACIKVGTQFTKSCMAKQVKKQP